MKLVTKYQISAINICWEKCDEKWAYMFNVYKNQQRSANRYRWKCFWTHQIPTSCLPTFVDFYTHWTYMLIFRRIFLSKYWWQKSDISSQAKQQSRQTGSRNLTGPKTLPTIWHTYMKLVTKYQISAINSCWEKYLGRTEGWTEVKQYTIPLLRWYTSD
jgi:hypothetical protein